MAATGKSIKLFSKSDHGVIQGTISLGKESFSRTITRAGIIPFTVYAGSIFLCLGKDRVHQEYTDFGGGFSRRRDIRQERCAVVELRQESLEVFNIRVDQINECPYISNEEMMIIFYPISHEKFQKASDEFEAAKSSLDENEITKIEVDDIEWFRLSELQIKINTKKVYCKVIKIIQPVIFSLEIFLKSHYLP